MSNDRVPLRAARFGWFRVVHVALLLGLLLALGRVAYGVPGLIEQLMRLSAGAWR